MNIFFTLTCSKDASFFPVSIPNVQHPLASFLLLLTDLHAHSPPAWPSAVTTFTLFYPLRNLALADIHRSTAGAEIFSRTLHLWPNRAPFPAFLQPVGSDISLCFIAREALSPQTHHTRHILSLSFYSFLTAIWSCHELLLKKPPKKHFNQGGLKNCNGAAGETTDLFLHSSGQF